MSKKIDLLSETLYLLWLHNDVINTELVKAFNNEFSKKEIDDIFTTISAMGFGIPRMIAGDKFHYHKLQLSYKNDKNEIIDERFNYTLTDLKIWQKILELDFSHINRCPKPILEKLQFKDSLKKTVDIGVFESLNLRSGDYLKVDNDEIKVFLKMFTFGNGDASTTYSISHFYNCGILAEEVEPVLKEMEKKNLVILTYKETIHKNYIRTSTRIDSVRCVDSYKAWQMVLDYDFSYIRGCPKHIAEKLGYEKLKNINTSTGVFESIRSEETLRKLILNMLETGNKLELVPDEIADILYTQLTDKNKILYPKEFAHFKIEIFKILQNLKSEGIVIKQSDGYQSKSRMVNDWKKAIEEVPERIYHCPDWILEILKPTMKKARDYGVFENTSFRDLLQSAPEELKEIVWQQWKAPQNPKYHPEGNTFKHIMTVVNRAINKYPNNINLILAAFFHDLGKFASLGWKNGIPTQHGHEDVSKQLVQKFADWIIEKGGDVEEVEYIVTNHMKIKPDTWNVMRQKKKDIIMQNPAYKNLQSFGEIDKGGLHENIDFKDILFDYSDYAINESSEDEFNPEFEPELAGELVDKDKIEKFMFAGKAIFTIRNNQTMNRFTFRVMRPKKIKDDVYFVSVLTGGDNYSMYSFFGTIFSKNVFKVSAKSAKIGLDSQSIKVFQWFFNTLISNNPFPPQVQIWHEGVCGKCGKKLTVPESVDIGLGPVCARSAQLWERSQRLVQTNNKTGLFDNFNYVASYKTFETKEEKKEDKMKQLEHDWENIYKLQKKVVTALRKVKSEKGYGDEFSNNSFDDKIKEVLSKFDVKDLKIKGIGTGYEVSFKIENDKFKYEFFTNGKLKDSLEGAEKIKESTDVDAIFLGQQLKDVKDLIDSFRTESAYNLFDKTIVAMDDFVSEEDAVEYLKSQGYAIGRMQAGAPTGAKLGNYDIQKWRNLGNDAAELDAIIVNIEERVCVLYFNFPEI